MEEQKIKDWYEGKDGNKVAYLFNKEGKIIDTENQQGHIYRTKRQCPRCGEIMEMQPISSTYIVRGKYIWFCHSDMNKAGRLTIDEMPRNPEFILSCVKCHFGESFKP